MCSFFAILFLCFFYLCCVRFYFFSTTPWDWLGRMSPKLPILCEVGCKTLTESVNQSTLSSDETGPCQSSEGELTILLHVVIQVDTVSKRSSKSVSQNNHCVLYILLPNNRPTSTY